MEIVDAFLFASAIAYYVAILLPKPATRNIKNRFIERLSMFMCGTIILANLFLFNNQVGWLVMGVVWGMASLASYLGYSKWNVLWKNDVSEAAQMYMAGWDLLIAWCCLLKF